MRHSEATATTSDGLNLYSQTWLPDGSPKGMLAFIHGMGEHSGRYRHLGATLADAGYGLHMADLRGHGKSPGKRGHIMTWEDFRRDAATIMHSARQAAPDSKHFFGGHSLGGLIGLSMALDNPRGYQGVVISAPGLRPAFHIPGWKLRLGRQLSKITPEATLSSGLPPGDICRAPAVVEAYISDPLVHDKTSARMAIESFKAQAEVLACMDEIKLPILILHGTADRLVDIQTGRAAFQRIGSPDKTWLEYDGFYHEVFNELERERPIRDMINWMDAHL